MTDMRATERPDEPKIEVVSIPLSDELSASIDEANRLREEAMELLSPEGRALIEEAERKALHDMLFGTGE